MLTAIRKCRLYCLCWKIDIPITFEVNDKVDDFSIISTKIVDLKTIVLLAWSLAGQGAFRRNC